MDFKSLLKSILAFVIVGLSTSSFATTVTVGSASLGAETCAVFTCNAGPSVGQSIDYQQIYSSTAFSGPITFNTITFFDTRFPGPVVSGTYNITFSYTSSPLGTPYLIPGTGTQSFFSGALGGPIGSSFSISGTPFAYDPSSGNLLMEIIVTDQASVPNDGTNGYLDADFSSGGLVSRAFQVTGFSANPLVNGEGFVTAFSTAATPLPAALPLFASGLGLMGLLSRRRKKQTA